MIDEKLKNEIIEAVKPLAPERVILFGSYAWGAHNADSDVDLVVVLNQSGMSRSYSDLRKNKKNVSKYLMGIRKRIPVDLLVYTKDEWNYMISSDTSFIKNIIKNGIQLA